MSDDPHLAALADRLDALAEDLDEVMFDRLREASAAKTGRPADDKRLVQARRAVEKASRLLRGRAETDTPDGP